MPVITGNTLDFFSHSAEQTRRLGWRLGRLVEPGDIVLLRGPLGAGKTQFAQGIARGLGVEQVVRSPTYTLVSVYDGDRMRLYHVDLYRVEGDADIATVGVEEYVAYEDGVVVVEWPDRAREWLPAEALTVELQHVDETKRRMIITATGERYEDLLLSFKEVAFGVK